MIIFDLDGTLIDSSIGIYNAYRDSCLKFNFSFVNYNKFKATIGPPFPVMFKHLHPNADQLLFDKIPATFLSLYSNQKYYNDFILREDTQKFIHELSENNSLSIITNKHTAIAKSIIETSNLSSFFKFVAGRDFFSTQHTKYDVFKKLLEMNKAPYTSIYVGDTKEDLQLSTRLGINFVGLASLFGGELSPQSFLPSYDRLKVYFDNL